MMTEEKVQRSLGMLKVAYDFGVEDALKDLVKALEEEEKSLRRYGRTELYGVHKAIQLIKERIKK
jgi:hypothetical protein